VTPLSRVLAAGLALAAAGPAAAQGGAPDPDARRLRPGVDSLAIYLVRGADTTRTGTLRDELAVVREGDRDLLRRVYVSSDRVLGARVDTLVDGLADLRPVRHRSRTERSAEALDFAAGRASGWLRLANQDSVGVDAAAAGAYNASSFDLVLRASSLRDGWEATVPAFLPPARAISPMRARVTGVESVGGEPCWRVQAEFSGTPVTFWIGQSSRALRQQVLQVRPDVQILFRRAAPVAPGGRAT
jgi:hypothetical protein